MSLHFSPMDEAAARAIHAWRYEPPYDLYNLASEPLPLLLRAFLDPQNAYYAIRSKEGELVAYCCFGHDAQVPGGDYGSPAGDYGSPAGDYGSPAGDYGSPSGDYGSPAVDVGLGLRPDLTGQGRGPGYVRAVLDFAREASAGGSESGDFSGDEADPPAFRVTVAAFNQRAQRVWEKAGFRIVQRFERAGDGLPFVVMVGT